MKEKFYAISKLTKGENGLIESVYGHAVEDLQLTEEAGEFDRNWLLSKYNSHVVKHIEKKVDGGWRQTGSFKYNNGFFSWDKVLPKNLPKRKTFVSYYHKDDQEYREKFENFFSDLILSKSVNDGEIDEENSDTYIKKLIQDGHLSDTTVLVVLLGPRTRCRKHVDWEISGALDVKVGDKYAGLLGLKLPSHPDYGTGEHKYPNLPTRLSENLKSGYARISDWTDDRVKFQDLIEEVFSRRAKDDLIVNRAVPQMKQNTCG